MDSNNVGNKIQEIRKERGLTQKQLAEKAQISYSTLAKMESGIIDSPKIRNIQNISKILEVNMEAFTLPTRLMSENLNQIISAFTKNPALEIVKNISDMQIEMINSIKEITNPFNTYYEASLKSVLDSISRIPTYTIAKSIENIIKVDQKWFETINNAINESNKNNQNILENSGWFFSPSLMKHKYEVYDIIDSIGEGNPSAMILFCKKYFDSKHFAGLDETVEGWYTNPRFHQRQELIDEAIKNHKRKSYASSVVMMLTQLEGIAGEYCISNSAGIKDSDSTKKIKYSLTKGGLTEGILYSDSILLSIESYIFATTQKLNRDSRYKGSFSGILNRHAILHGITTNFGTVENSYKCILLLDIFSCLK